jgi:hypothetical protein
MSATQQMEQRLVKSDRPWHAHSLRYTNQNHPLTDEWSPKPRVVASNGVMATACEAALRPSSPWLAICAISG